MTIHIRGVLLVIEVVEPPHRLFDSYAILAVCRLVLYDVVISLLSVSISATAQYHDNEDDEQ